MKTCALILAGMSALAPVKAFAYSYCGYTAGEETFIDRKISFESTNKTYNCLDWAVIKEGKKDYPSESAVSEMVCGPVSLIKNTNFVLCSSTDSIIGTTKVKIDCIFDNYKDDNSYSFRDRSGVEFNIWTYGRLRTKYDCKSKSPNVVESEITTYLMDGNEITVTERILIKPAPKATPNI